MTENTVGIQPWPTHHRRAPSACWMQMLENGSLHGDRLRLRGLEERGRMEAKTWKAAQNTTAEEKHPSALDLYVSPQEQRGASNGRSFSATADTTRPRLVRATMIVTRRLIDDEKSIRRWRTRLRPFANKIWSQGGAYLTFAKREAFWDGFWRAAENTFGLER